MWRLRLSDFFLFVFFFQYWASIQGLRLARQMLLHLSQDPSPFYFSLIFR
jgi:hypothetical protein